MKTNLEKIITGLGMMLAIIYTAYTTGANLWPVAVLTAIATGAGYFISNFWYVSNSPQGTIDWKEALKGALLASFSATVTVVVTLWDGAVFDWKQLGLAFISAFMGYLFPTLFSGQPKTVK